MLLLNRHLVVTNQRNVAILRKPPISIQFLDNRTLVISELTPILSVYKGLMAPGTHSGPLIKTTTLPNCHIYWIDDVPMRLCTGWYHGYLFLSNFLFWGFLYSTLTLDPQLVWWWHAHVNISLSDYVEINLWWRSRAFLEYFCHSCEQWSKIDFCWNFARNVKV